MEKMKKSHIIEIIVIVIVASVIGLVYNYTLPKPLPLIYTKKEIQKLDDDLLFGNSNSDTKAENAAQEEKTVTYEQMLKIIENDDFIIIDARNAELFNKSKIGNSLNIFPYSDEAEVVNKIFDLPQDKKIVVYCDGGNCDSSHKIAEMLLSFGYDNTFIYSGGWEEWSNKQGIE